MPTNLRFHHDPHARREPDPPTPATLRFPLAMAAARKHLVAGTVELAARPEESGDVIGRVDQNGATTHGTTRIIRSVEHTLDELQARLDRLKRDAEEPFKFPARPDHDDRPRAA